MKKALETWQPAIATKHLKKRDKDEKAVTVSDQSHTGPHPSLNDLF